MWTPRGTPQGKHYAKKHAAEVCSLLEDPTITVAHTDIAMNVAGTATSTTAAAVLFMHGEAKGKVPAATKTQPYGASPPSPELAETRTVLFALEACLSILRGTVRPHTGQTLQFF